MESLKGLMIAIVVFLLFLVPAILEVSAYAISTSQLNKVGAEMTQIVGASSEYDSRVASAIALAESNYNINVTLSTTSYGLNDTVQIQLTKNAPSFYGCLGPDGSGTMGNGCTVPFQTFESVLITKRGG